MNRVAIIQARLGSTRLPGKCLLKVKGKSVLAHIITRIQEAKCIDRVILATTTNVEDKQLVDIAESLGVEAYQGSVDDVLSRFYHAAQLYEADVICRITADDPFKDPQIIDKIMGYFIKENYDYVSNTLVPTYPEGLDVEVFSMETLFRAYSEANKLSEREHVTPYIWNKPHVFKIFNISHNEDLSYLRWTLDNPCDWVFIQQVYEELYDEKKLFLMADILNLLRNKPHLAEFNKNIKRNEGYLKSVAEDEI